MASHGHDGHRKRMRDRFVENGLAGFAPHEALEMLLFSTIKRQNTNPIAHDLVAHFGSFSAVLEATPEQLEQVPGIGAESAFLLSLILPLARYAEREQLGERPVITNYRESKAYCKHLFSGKTEEVLYVVCLDAQGRALRAVPAITGTIDEIAIYPRKIVSDALQHKAHSVLLAHNHPSGVLEPSDADIQTTDMLRNALAGVDIPLLDHVIYADGDCLSMMQWQQMQRIAPMLASDQERKAADKKRGSKRGAQAMREPEHNGNT